MRFKVKALQIMTIFSRSIKRNIAEISEVVKEFGEGNNSGESFSKGNSQYDSRMTLCNFHFSAQSTLYIPVIQR